jgi:DNA recombination protein RmuC
MGFHMLALQEKGDEVWKILEGTKAEFKTFEKLMGSMESKVGTVQNTIQKLGVRTRAINRTLRDVGSDAGDLALSPPPANGFDGLLPMLVASEEEE